MNGDYDPGTFLKQLIPHLTVGVDLQIKIGFSFIGIQFKSGKPRYSYFYAAEDLCTINKIFHKIDDVYDFVEELIQKPYYEYLHETFLESESGERFANSGINPLQLVANYIWIRK